MSYSLIIDKKPGPQIATNSGWVEVIDYVERIYQGERKPEFRQIIRFATHGLTREAPTLRKEIETLLKEIPPRQDTTRTVLGHLHTALRGVKSGKLVYLTDGVGTDDEEEPEE